MSQEILQVGGIPVSNIVFKTTLIPKLDTAKITTEGEKVNSPYTERRRLYVDFYGSFSILRKFRDLLWKEIMRRYGNNIPEVLPSYQEYVLSFCKKCRRIDDIRVKWCGRHRTINKILNQIGEFNNYKHTYTFSITDRWAKLEISLKSGQYTVYSEGIIGGYPYTNPDLEFLSKITVSGEYGDFAVRPHHSNYISSWMYLVIATIGAIDYFIDIVKKYINMFIQ